MISGLSGNSFEFPWILRKLCQVAVSQNQVVWCPAKISSFPSHVERFHLAPILSGDRWLKQAWGGGTWGFWEARQIHILRSCLKEFWDRRSYVCVCVCIYICIYMYICTCVCMVVTEVRKIAQRSLAHICMCLYILFALYPILICSNIKHCQGDVTWGMFVWNGLCTQCQGCQEQEDVSFLEADPTTCTFDELIREVP